MEKRIVSLRIQESYITALDQLVEENIFPNRSAAVSESIYRLLREESSLAERRKQERKNYTVAEA
jgi:Arc/MetJ-type ribon-helix-helix transcriptional regulator